MKLNKRMVKIILIFCILIIGCVETAEKDIHNNITDSTGRNISISLPVERVVTLTSESAEVMRALGAEDKIVGVSKYVADNKPLWGELADKPVVGSVFSPNYEAIVELKPDVVITYVRWSEDLEEKLAPFGITVVRLDFYKSKTLRREIRTLGRIIGKKKKAEELIGFYDHYEQLITSRIETIPPQKRVRVYIEGYQDYHSAGRNTGWAQQTTLAGGRNIAENLTGEYPVVSAEWVITENPDIIVKAVSGSRKIFGYTINDPEQAKQLQDKIMSRPGWNTINAVKNKRVYLISGDIISGPRYIIAVVYLAKQFYPHIFRDLSPQEIHREYMEMFQGIEYQGIWAYPPTGLTVPDAQGRNVIIQIPVGSIVLLLLGYSEKVVGVSRYIPLHAGMFPELAKKPVVGTGFHPNYGRIAELRENLDFGIKILYLETCDPEQSDSSLMLLARLFGKEERAAEFIKWKHECFNAVKKQEEKPQVFKEISPEWLLKKNLDIIRNKVMERSGIDSINAVRNGRVYVIHSISGLRSFIGVCYLAKWFYPESGMDHREYFEQWLGVKYHGAYAYPQ